MFCFSRSTEGVSFPDENNVAFLSHRIENLFLFFDRVKNVQEARGCFCFSLQIAVERYVFLCGVVLSSRLQTCVKFFSSDVSVTALFQAGLSEINKKLSRWQNYLYAIFCPSGIPCTLCLCPGSSQDKVHFCSRLEGKWLKPRVYFIPPHSAL